MVTAAILLAFRFGVQDPQILECTSNYVVNNMEARTSETVQGPSLSLTVRGKGAKGILKEKVPGSTQYGPGFSVEYQSRPRMLGLWVGMKVDDKLIPVLNNRSHVDLNEPVHTEFLLPNDIRFIRQDAITMKIDCALK